MVLNSRTWGFAFLKLFFLYFFNLRAKKEWVSMVLLLFQIIRRVWKMFGYWKVNIVKSCNFFGFKSKGTENSEQYFMTEVLFFVLIKLRLLRIEGNKKILAWKFNENYLEVPFCGWAVCPSSPTNWTAANLLFKKCSF
jgi:hypothetical protein